MNTDEMITYNDRVYVNPDISRDEQMAFVDTLRDLQAQKNAQIATETHNLGTDVEPHLGGLSGSEEYWQSKYQTPQVNAMVADMKAVAQQSALNTALQNYTDALKNRYNQAYRNYQKRANAPKNNPTTNGGVEYEDTSDPSETVGRVEPSFSPMGSGDFGYTSNNLNSNTNSLNISGDLAPSNSLTPNGTVNIQRDKFGNITSLTYNGKTFTGDAAQQRYQWLQSTGTISGRK